LGAGKLDLALTIARQLGFALERLQADAERGRAEQAKELVLNESKHRIKNTLATVQAIARQALPTVQPDEMSSFFARLQALGRANELLTAEHRDRAPVRAVVEHALEPFQTGEKERIDAAGPNAWLSAQGSPRLTMCLHEIATNAAKYGALSNRSGRVRIAWELRRDALILSWKEAGGPPVAEPGRQGFGSRLIEASGEPGSCRARPLRAVWTNPRPAGAPNLLP
jgi:two-component sensor histidine kinase